MTGLRVAMIGHGFMGAAHSQGWRTAPRVFDLPADPEMAVLVGRRADATAAAARTWGWTETATDWREVVARDDVDVVDIVTPGGSHAEIAIAALRAGKHVLCEKPLANTVPEAQAMADAAAESGSVAMVGFTYRRVPATTFARDLVAQGRLGRVHQVRVAYRQDWLVDPAAPLAWRLQREHAGSGALGDIGAHAVDLVQFVTGLRFTTVSGVLDTIVTERPVLAEAAGLSGTGGVETGRVTVDDIALVTGRLDNGALVGLEASRFATGRKNALTIEVSGEAGALAWDLEDLNTLWFHDRTTQTSTQGFARVLVTEPEHPYLAGWWPAGHALGYEHGFSHQVKDLVEGIAAGTPVTPTFADGLQVQQVLGAVERSAADDAVWTRVGAPGALEFVERDLFDPPAAAFSS